MAILFQGDRVKLFVARTAKPRHVKPMFFLVAFVMMPMRFTFRSAFRAGIRTNNPAVPNPVIERTSRLVLEAILRFFEVELPVFVIPGVKGVFVKSNPFHRLRDLMFSVFQISAPSILPDFIKRFAPVFLGLTPRFFRILPVFPAFPLAPISAPTLNIYAWHGMILPKGIVYV